MQDMLARGEVAEMNPVLLGIMPVFVKSFHFIGIDDIFVTVIVECRIFEGETLHVGRQA